MGDIPRQTYKKRGNKKMKQYTFKRTDNGIIGKAFEMTIKDLLNRRNADKVSPCGTADFIFNHKCYDTKQNGSCIRYNETERYIKGSNRVIYATHIACTITDVDADTVAVAVDLLNTDFYCVDRTEFIKFLEEIGCIKYNASRGTVNIQTVYNYKKDAYHGKKGRLIEAWASEHWLDDEAIDAIWDALN